MSLKLMQASISLQASMNTVADSSGHELRQAARAMLMRPLLCAEHDPDTFARVRRHEVTLDQWFTRRLGYRLQISSNTARLYKSVALVHRRCLHTASATPRPMTQRELVLLTLILAAVAAGPRVISLRDLIGDVHSAAADAEIVLGSEAVDRRAFVTVLKWMIAQGLGRELHEDVGRYEADADADAVIEIDPDRVALLPLPALARAEEPTQLLDRHEARSNTRQWLRTRLVEDPVLYRDDVTDTEWATLRRRLGEEAVLLDEMFGLQLEARAEGVLAIDPTERLSDIAFPAGNTLNHAALLIIDSVVEQGGTATHSDVEAMLAQLAKRHVKHWSKTQIANLANLSDRVIDLLIDMLLMVRVGDGVRALPAASRYAVEHRGEAGEDAGEDAVGDSSHSDIERESAGNSHAQGVLF